MTKLSKPDTESRKIPPCTAAGKNAIAEFLNYMQDRLQLALNDHRVLSMTDKSPRTLGMIRHYRNQLGTITYLKSVNDQRITLG